MFLQRFLSHRCNQQDNSTYNHCLNTVQTGLNFAAVNFCCKISLIWLGSSLGVYCSQSICYYNTVAVKRDSMVYRIGNRLDMKGKQMIVLLELLSLGNYGFCLHHPPVYNMASLLKAF